jgi:hypothetical protein
MNSSAGRQKSVSLTFRGFDVPAEEVAKLLGVAASRLGNRGEPVKQGVKTLLTRSYVIFSSTFASDYELSNMLPALLTNLGGVDRVLWLKDEVRPEFLEIHFDLPVQQSEDSQDGYLSEEAIADAFRLKACFSFSFF